jgi:hypothetical protein
MAGKAGAKRGRGGAAEGGIRLTAHPRARRDIGLAKGWGGLGAFVLVLVLSLQAGVPTAEALLRAIGGGVVGYVVAWGVAVTVWRHLALAEVERARRRLLEAEAAGGDAEASATG